MRVRHDSPLKDQRVQILALAACVLLVIFLFTGQSEEEYEGFTERFTDENVEETGTASETVEVKVVDRSVTAGAHFPKILDWKRDLLEPWLGSSAMVTRNPEILGPMMKEKGFQLARPTSMDVSPPSDVQFLWISSTRYVKYEHRHYFKPGKMIWKHEEGMLELNDKVEMHRRIDSYVSKKPNCHLRTNNFLPKTYPIDDTTSCKNFFTQHFEASSVWFLKEAGSEAGRGVKLISPDSSEDVQYLKEEYGYSQTTKQCNFKGKTRRAVMQKPIDPPLLVDGKKFDLRVFALIASFDPLMIYYRDGYVRMSSTKYSTESLDRASQLTNVAISSEADENADDSELKEGHVMSLDALVVYWRKSGVTRPETLMRRWKHEMKEIIVASILAGKVGNRDGAFDWIGFDFLSNEAGHLYLIELNIDPGLHVADDTDSDLKLGAVSEAIDIVVETNNRKALAREQGGEIDLYPRAVNTYKLIHDESVEPAMSILDVQCRI